MSFVTLAVIGGVTGLAGAAIQAGAASSAADTQANALRQSEALQQQMYNTTLANEQPYISAGQGAESQLNYLLGIPQQSGLSGEPAPSSSAGGFGSLNAPFTADTFKSMSPGYQFNLQQGGQGVLNQDASAQGGESGAALKDLMSFNQGYANNSFNNAFNQYQQQQTNTFNRLYGIAGLGSQAGSAGTTGSAQFASSIGNTASNIGTAQAAGQIGVANAISGGLNSASNTYSMTQVLPWLANQNRAYSGGPSDPGMGVT
jgi:hypothetical protein